MNTLLLPAVATGKPILDVIHHCDALTLLRALPDESVHCIISSPPYWNLRDYGVLGQLGLEPTPGEFVATLMKIFRECYRVLRSDGTMWINLGDSYANDTKWSGTTSGKHAADLQGTSFIGRNRTNTGLPSKSLIGIPWRVAFALQDDGWILRSEIIWHKPNAMPESVKDRPTKAHEHIFLLSKSEMYYYDNESVKENASNGDPTPPRGSHGIINTHLNRGNRNIFRGGGTYTNRGAFDNSCVKPNSIKGNNDIPNKLRNRRDVWTVPTAQTPYAHFATFPDKLIEPMVLAGCPIDGIVLDPFMGSGTVARVARKFDRHYLGCDLNREYVDLARRLLDEQFAAPLFDILQPAPITQLSFEALTHE